jgi:hypothetical protein
MIDIIRLTDDRYLAVAWKDGSVHYMCLTTDEVVAQKIAERSLAQKPTTNDVYLNIEKLVKNL